MTDSLIDYRWNELGDDYVVETYRGLGLVNRTEWHPIQYLQTLTEAIQWAKESGRSCRVLNRNNTVLAVYFVSSNVT